MKNIAINEDVSFLIMPNTSSSTQIQIRYSDEKTARTIQRAITPDNIGAPEDMQIRVMVNENILEIEIYSDRSIGSLISTLDDLLSCIQVAEITIEEI